MTEPKPIYRTNMNNDLMFSSATGKWDTPQDLIDDLATVFDWNVDVCASRPNVCANYIDETQDGLDLDIAWVVNGRSRTLAWCNPPYGRGVGKWLARALAESQHVTTVMLVPARTDTKWWQDHVPYASQVVFIKGRLKFGEATNSAPFPSAFVVFGKLSVGESVKLASYGWTVYKKIPNYLHSPTV